MVHRRRVEHCEWHFHTECPCWPVLGCIEVEFRKPEEGERICFECIKLGLRTSPSEIASGATKRVSYLNLARSRALDHVAIMHKGQNEPDADLDKPRHRQKCRQFCDYSRHV
jgi:hypothetical protein